MVEDHHRDHRNHVHDLDLVVIDLMEDHHAQWMKAVEMTCFSQETCGLLFNDVEKTTTLSETGVRLMLAVTANDELDVKMEQFGLS
jgi:hypothetical protein